ncbi:MAG: hypothetical protein GEV08_10225 [Acidimicrobiia bacterium]|nr:hypothetical protein [Acidimicrobiia bacterium]
MAGTLDEPDAPAAPQSLRRRALVAGLVAGGLCLLSACSGGSEAVAVGAQPSVTPSIYPLPPPTVEAAAEEAQGDHAATFVRTAEGVVLPDAEVTPGAVFEDVGAAEICDLHYSQGVRQPRFNAKVAVFASYGVSIRDRDIYQVDHLVPVSLGGSNAEENLWPLPYQDAGGAEDKDLVERQLRGLVCSNKVSLQEAQDAIAKNWWQAHQTYMGLPINPGSEGPEPWERPTTEPGEVVNGGLCAVEGEIGYTDPKHIRLTCTATSFGELRWQKRY